MGLKSHDWAVDKDEKNFILIEWGIEKMSIYYQFRCRACAKVEPKGGNRLIILKKYRGAYFFKTFVNPPTDMEYSEDGTWHYS